MAADLDVLQGQVEQALAGLPDGAGLTVADASVVAFGLAASPTVLDVGAMERHARAALAAGAGAEQLTEAMLLVALVGNHALHEAARVIVAATGGAPAHDPMRTGLRAEHVGDDAYWQRLEAELPGFLDALLALSPDGFQAFFVSCAVPFRGRALRPVLKELLCVGLDLGPTHRYGPGLRLHLHNALRLGANPAQVRDVMVLAEAAGAHPGVP